MLAPRPNDYHPDHRYTGVLLQDAAFMVTVPNVAPDTPALRQQPGVPVLRRQLPEAGTVPSRTWPSRSTTRSTKKIDMIDAHVSQMYEWLPWLNGRLDDVPKDAAARRQWLEKERPFRISPAVRAALVKYYGADAGAKVQYAEAFEISEYGRRRGRRRDPEALPVLAAVIGVVTGCWWLG